MRGFDIYFFFFRFLYEEDKLWIDDVYNVIRKGYLILKYLFLVNLKNKKIYFLLYNKLNIILVKIWCFLFVLVIFDYEIFYLINYLIS